MTDAFNIQLSLMDEERFGVRTARTNGVRLEQLPAVMDFCQSNQVKFLIARCHVNELPTVQAMEGRGFTLMDTLVYFTRRLSSKPIPMLSDKLTIRPVHPDEADQVSVLAAKAFRGYGGHYHADPRLDRDKCDKVYSSWAYRSCLRELADEVLVADSEGVIVGFVSLRIHNPAEGEGPLYAVDAAVQGQNVGRNLVIGALRWFEVKQVETVMISTQITNLPSQKVLLRLGFEPSRAQYTLHKWFD